MNCSMLFEMLRLRGEECIVLGEEWPAAAASGQQSTTMVPARRPRLATAPLCSPRNALKAAGDLANLDRRVRVAAKEHRKVKGVVATAHISIEIEDEGRLA